MIETKQLSKRKRGEFDYRFDKNAEILIAKRHDNKCVTIASNYDTIEPLGRASHHDWLVGKYSIRIRGKKWYWPLFTRMIDMSITNAWILYRKVHGASSLNCLDFRRAVAVTFLKLGNKGLKRKYQTHGVVPDVRYDGNQHWMRRREKQRRCQYPSCTKKPLTYCCKCDVTLCADCFEPYHKK